MPSRRRAKSRVRRWRGPEAGALDAERRMHGCTEGGCCTHVPTVVGGEGVALPARDQNTVDRDERGTQRAGIRLVLRPSDGARGAGRVGGLRPAGMEQISQHGVPLGIEFFSTDNGSST